MKTSSAQHSVQEDATSARSFLNSTAFCSIFAVVMLLSLWTFSQTLPAEVKRKVYLRAGPSMTTPKGTLLQPGDQLQILELQPSNDFYRVQTEDGDEGWVGAGNISLKQQ